MAFLYEYICKNETETIWTSFHFSGLTTNKNGQLYKHAQCCKQGAFKTDLQAQMLLSYVYANMSISSTSVIIPLMWRHIGAN